ncbi:zinc finger protein 532-like [Maniola jurtina]|uniref:zinc finger protein 532-like n=1 Tax=Maniola jurtina TaxID=191418 RepID=UPI001E6881A2|nr:zinc finger protein 532-like [Maniola jurtina]XP_045771984.1 zinc finger protein 532-like [Maniola jurtina]
MNTDNIMTDRLTIKDIIFTKALPNYNIPVPTDGYKIFPCTDCGDKFLFESSYEYHINRKSLKISYFCRHCVKVTVFYNRCKLLAHIRSHAFKTATITVSDLQIEMLPLEHFNLSILPAKNQISQQKKTVCHECNKNINIYGVALKDRATHYMQYTNESHSCPICMFLLPTVCALEAHLRIHLNAPPFFCPECGMHLPNKVASYPFDHSCEGFKMMKSATRLLCKIDDCNELFHPDDYSRHLKTHLKKVYRCSFCLEIWYHNDSLTKCSLCKNGNLTSYVHCPQCPNKLFAESLIERHLNSHCLRDKLNDQCYPCTTCNVAYAQMYNLLNHHVNTHSAANLKTLLSKFFVKATTATKTQKSRKHVYHRVVKKCSKCLRSFTYRCLDEDIRKLPNDCPYKCISNTETQSRAQSDETNNDLEIECFLCKRRISQNWDNIKVHYAQFHNNHKCIDIQVLVKKLDKKLLPKKSKNRNFTCAKAIAKNKSKKNKLQMNKVALNAEKDESIEIPRDPNVCIICNHNCENSKNLESHMITHRDPSMAYQCLECGKCFVVKPSFSTHLLLEHSITNVQEYIDTKPCYNESALLKNRDDLNPPIEQPVKENQCRICREQFENSNDLEKHFRVHGMAFLMKNAHKNNTSP